MSEDKEDNVVVAFPNAPDTTVPLTLIKDDQICPPDDVLNALVGELKSVVVFGFREDGEVVLASSLSRMSDVNYMVDVVKAKIVSYGV